MRLEDLAPMLEAWDRLTTAINGFVVSSPAAITARAAAMDRARTDMREHELPESVQHAWGDLQQAIGAALAAVPHDMSAAVMRLEESREAMRAAIWDLARQITPAQQAAVETLAAVMAERHPKPRAARRSRL